MNELKKRSNNWTNSERHAALSTILNQHIHFLESLKGPLSEIRPMSLNGMRS
ncbi:hypothetical protein MAR_027827 [Mya arenaria]|uniref:Uncharacterized protein n=1 Tax=Mya arenaria TaxID=6604 RepID=A0ABY7EXR6_MYAAR|nr:hypothetical protein MAR_027827 [Mya arenaria]